MWESDHKESWAQKNGCFWIVVLEKNLESPLDCREIQPVNPKGNQSWIFIGRNNTEAEAPIFWPPYGNDAGKDWRQQEKGITEDEMIGWHQQLGGHESEQALGAGDGQGSLVCCSPKSQTWLSDRTELNLAYLFPFMDLGLSVSWDWLLSWWEAGIQSILAEA